MPEVRHGCHREKQGMSGMFVITTTISSGPDDIDYKESYDKS
jgi:hypothetical protein